jgi:putative PIN family toxin of toxin-antitoxin system
MNDELQLNAAAQPIAQAHLNLKWVLDTNVVLDWLVFGDPSTHRLRQNLEGGSRIVSSDLALCELTQVLAYSQLRLAQERQQLLIAQYRSHALVWAEASQAPPGFPRCRDRDDQPFLELAWTAKADGLVTRDKAILKLKPKMRRFGVRVMDLAELNDLFQA